jgi:hypothetical protein
LRFTITLLLFSVAAVAQPPEGAPPPRPDGAKQRPAPKNLKVLPPTNLIPTMQAFRAALGVQCTFCHVEGNFASDDNPKKDVARKMITMTKEINSANFTDGKMHVSCYTCHRGAEEPKMAPPPAEKPAE